MNMQDVDFELKYKPGKDDKDPMDYLSRHQLPDTVQDEAEATVGQVAEHFTTITKKIKSASNDDELYQALKKIILQSSWGIHADDLEIRPYFNIQEELSVLDDMIF